MAKVLAIYDEDCRERQSNKRALDGRIERLTEWWWGDKRLSEVSGGTCKAYAAARGNAGGARRDLQDLRAAIRHHAALGLHRGIVQVSLPEKGAARDRWLTRSEAAALLWACWRYREMQKRHRGPDKGRLLPTKKRPLRDLARFILIGLYTGTRAGAIAAASPYRREGHSYGISRRASFTAWRSGRRPRRSVNHLFPFRRDSSRISAAGIVWIEKPVTSLSGEARPSRGPRRRDSTRR